MWSVYYFKMNTERSHMPLTRQSAKSGCAPLVLGLAIHAPVPSGSHSVTSSLSLQPRCRAQPGTLTQHRLGHRPPPLRSHTYTYLPNTWTLSALLSHFLPPLCDAPTPPTTHSCPQGHAVHQLWACPHVSFLSSPSPFLSSWIPTTHSIVPAAMCERASLRTPSPTLDTGSLHFSHRRGAYWDLMMDLTCVSLMTTMLSNFSCVYWPFVYLLLGRDFSTLLSVIYWVVLNQDDKRVFSEYKILTDKWIANIFSPVLSVMFLMSFREV